MEEVEAGRMTTRPKRQRLEMQTVQKTLRWFLQPGFFTYCPILLSAMHTTCTYGAALFTMVNFAANFHDAC